MRLEYLSLTHQSRLVSTIISAHIRFPRGKNITRNSASLNRKGKFSTSCGDSYKYICKEVSILRSGCSLCIGKPHNAYRKRDAWFDVQVDLAPLNLKFAKQFAFFGLGGYKGGPRNASIHSVHIS